jgi:hypothetical protein
MDCAKVHQLLDDYLDGSLEQEARSLVEEHLSSCADCTRTMAFMRAYRREMRELRAVRAPADFMQRLHTQMERRRPLKNLRARLFPPSGLKLPLELAGVAALALVALVLFGVIGGGGEGDRFALKGWRAEEAGGEGRAPGGGDGGDLPPEVIAMEQEEGAGEPGEKAAGAGKPFGDLPPEPLAGPPGDEFPRDLIPEILGEQEPPPEPSAGQPLPEPSSAQPPHEPSPGPPPPGPSGDRAPEGPRASVPSGERLPESYPRETVTAQAAPDGERAVAGDQPLPETTKTGPGEVEVSEEPAVEAEPAGSRPEETEIHEETTTEAEHAAPEPPVREAAETGPEEPQFPEADTAGRAPGEDEAAAGIIRITVLLAQDEPAGGPGAPGAETTPGGPAVEQVAGVVRAVEALGGKIVFKEYRGSSDGPAVVDAVVPGSGYRMLIHELERLGRVTFPEAPPQETRREPPDPRKELQLRIRFVTDGGGETE